MTLMEAVTGKGQGLLVRATRLREHQAMCGHLQARQDRAEFIREAFYPDWDPDTWWEQVFPRLHI